MKMSLPSFRVIALLAATTVSPLAGYGQSASVGQPEQENSQDDQGAPRVARLDSLQGEVSFERAGDKEWVEAVRNLPLLSGDQIYTGDGSTAVIQLAHGTFIRLFERTALAITDLPEQGAQFEITSGAAVAQVYRLDDAFGRFEIDTPVAAAMLQRDGAYRVQVLDNGETEFTTRDGLAEVTTEDGTLKVRAGYKLQAGGKGSGKLEVVAVVSFDDWDLGGRPLDTPIDAVTTDPAGNASPDYVGSYQDTYTSLYGLDELCSYGVWTNLPVYGNCWVPRVGYGWAPYRSGRWLWIPALGWTWLPSEPWGWAPYHYGRWSFVPGLGWAWVPGFGPQPAAYGYGYGYYAWRPALVYFFNYTTPGGRFVGWQPLRPGDVWHRPGWYERHTQPGWGRPTLQATNPGLSVVPLGVFNGSAAGRPEAPNPEHARILQGIERPRPGAPVIAGGLAGVQPGRLAAIPVRPVGFGTRVAVQPPAGIIGRPVVTRHLPAVIAGDDNQIPRQRRLVEPVTPAGSGLNRDSATGSGGERTFNSGGQDNTSHGAKFRKGESPVTERGAGQDYGEPRNNQRYDSPRNESPANRPAHQSDRGSSTYTGGSGGQGNSSQGNSSAGHTQSHTDSGGQSSGSSGSSTQHSGGQSAGSSGHSGGQNSGSSTQAQPSKKN
jgi:hypothetical protein